MSEYERFLERCESEEIQLTPKQKELAMMFFSMPMASGKSFLLALLWSFDNPNINPHLTDSYIERLQNV